MFLYDERLNVINIYDLKSDKAVLENFRKEKLKLIPEDKVIFKTKQVSCNIITEPLFEKMADD